MKNVIIILSIQIILLFSACQKKKEIHAVPPTDSCQAIVLYNPNDTSAYHFDPFEIKSLVLEGNDLKITLSYGGGCAQHDFSLVWNQYSMQPRNVLRITHNAHSDLCKALITRDLCFNLSLLKGNNIHGETNFQLGDSYGNIMYVKYDY